MKTRVILGAAGLAGAAVLVGQLAANNATNNVDRTVSTAAESRGQHEEVETYGGTPDVYIWLISGQSNWSAGSYRAYSVGTTSCNEGTSPLSWVSGTNQHPVIGQSMFRLKGGQNGHGRFEQIGQAWLKHGFCALDFTACGSCQGTGCSSLGVGCSDPYTASRNGSQGPAGPKYQVNATTGYFPYPPASPSYSGATARRLRVLKTDVELATNPGAQYWFEAQYVHPQDSPEDGARSIDNVSYRKTNLSSNGTATGYAASTVQKFPGLHAWAQADPEVVYARYYIAGEGTYYLGTRVYDNGDGTWDYEFALQNQDSDRCAGGFAIPVPAGVTVTNVGFHDVDYHSGDGLAGDYDGTDWIGVHAGGEVRWQTAETHDQNANGNALRWGTLYNFRFTADSPPESVTGEFAFFKSQAGGPAVWSLTNTRGPSEIAVDCPADFDGSGDVGFNDLVSLLAQWGNCPGCDADLDGSGDVGFNDLVTLLASWGPCP